MFLKCSKGNYCLKASGGFLRKGSKGKPCWESVNKGGEKAGEADGMVEKGYVEVETVLFGGINVIG